MQATIAICLTVALIFSPMEAHAQHGRGGGQRGGTWQGGNHGGAGSSSGGTRSSQGRTASNAPQARQHQNANHHAAANHHPAATHHPAAVGAHNFSHRPAYHGNWYHGDWHGHWAHPWGYRPYGWYGGWGWGWGLGFGAGIATVGVVSLGSPWGWGYYSYWNPYWVAPVGGVTYINYSQPIVVAAPPIVAVQPSDAANTPPSLATTKTQENALASFETARGMFKRGDYSMALSQTNRAIAQMPTDTLMHEFRGLCLFATKDYQQSAAAIYAVLSIGPGWDAATLQGLYGNPAVYDDQLRALEQYCDEHPQTAHAQFLLAYHEMLGGRDDQAIARLERVVELEPQDQLSAQLLKGLQASPTDQPTMGDNPPLAEPVRAAQLIGDWKASRPDGSKFELSLSGGNRFSWKATQHDKQQQLQGTFTLADNYLILSASNQNALVGHVALEPDGRLKYRLAGGSPTDPGLTFTR